MGFAKIINNRLGEKIYTMQHSSGLRIVVAPIDGYSSSYAIFGTKYGSIDDCFKKSNEENYKKVPAGIAHFLEHKLFENEDCDAFARYAETGASANAYTSFDKTCYLFSCTDKLYQSLEILLDFVQSPYFTKETVQKEQGIIAQEIKMYDDSPEWRVYFNLLTAMYPKHPVHIDIAGTVDSIAKIDDSLLYDCYRTFYNLNNMVLVVAGDVDKDEVIKIADKMLKPSEEVKINRCLPEEKQEVGQSDIHQRFPVATPIFMLGFKEKTEQGRISSKKLAQMEVTLEIIAGKASPLYRRLLDAGLINQSFSSEIFEGAGYLAEIFAGESSDPKQVRDEIIKEIESLKTDGIPQRRFEAARRVVYGRSIAEYSTAENVANILVEYTFSNRQFYSNIEEIAKMELKDVQTAIENAFEKSKTALSIVSNQA